MDSKILLGKILQRFKDSGCASAEGLNSFGYIRETENSIFVTRENGEDTPIPFNKIIAGIDGIKAHPELYDKGPGELREIGITYVNSPVFALLRLLDKNEYK